ncbi:hypothetical protein K435DRAFT_556357, partial [Dendrothele bispora CBS 962.96]
TPEEWAILEEMRPFLKTTSRATKRISADNRPLVAEVIPIMDVVTRQAETIIEDDSKSNVIRAAAAHARAISNKYYARTDDSKMYKICMILHPKYKTVYFDQANWESDWKDTARQIVREEWETHY